MTGRPPVDPLIRFWSKVHKCEDGCWRFIYDYDADYQGFRYDPKKPGIGAHVYSYDLHKSDRKFLHHNYRGSRKNNLFVLHTCDVRNCVNPDHLFLGTQQQNIDDMRAKGRQRYLSGKDNPMYGRSGALNPMFGKKREVTAETRAKISASNMGKKHTLEARKRISESQKGRVISSEAIAKMKETKRARRRAVQLHAETSECAGAASFGSSASMD